MAHAFQQDVDAVQRIGAVPTILDVVCRATGMGFAAVARVTEDRWVACQVLDNIGFGLPAGGELKVETTLCHEIRQHRQVIAIDNVAEDPVYSSHHTPQIYGLQSYISVPITMPDGRFFGTLCAIHPEPAEVNNPQVIGTLTLFAELLAYHLEAEDKLAAAETRATDQQANSDLREQFIAVLGHDLRNPLAAIDGGANILLREGAWTEKTPVILRLMKNSVTRMSGLIDNVLDLARSRLGGGIALNLDAERPLKPTLEQVVDEIRAANPARVIDAEIDIPRAIKVDHHRIAQMFSNLLGNAITHGADDQPIHVQVKLEDEATLALSVINASEPIPPEMMEHLFKAFHRGQVRSNAEGLGLGLYIAAQIAEAHGGKIDVHSDAEATRFTFRMPLG
ncbi:MULTISPECIES: GAF domain-containing sensor histidine kinase [unclassified Devosia]|uniref:GAF domain-containing sensor histidine kinase n=1 Tax=unclassified Devosia TaxID=196773 RepID=UPI001556E911|nr:MULTISPECIES: GAF domain-containing sensor histidine kinase [unclassified Devosia]